MDESILSDYSGAIAALEPCRIERRTGLVVEEFRAEYLVPRRPVILADAAAAWSLSAGGTPDCFRRRYGKHVVRVLGQECSLRELLDRLQASTREKPGPYPCKFEIAKDFRELLAELSPRFAYAFPDRQNNVLIPQRLFDGVNNLEIFFGGSGGSFPYLHYDVMRLHAWITQLHGDKEFILYAPGQEQFLYVNPEIPWQSTIRNHHSPDFARYPLFRHARAQRVVIHAGETLFLPCGWWHTARSLTLTISVAFDQLGPDNWNDFIADVVAQRRRQRRYTLAFLLGAYLRLIGPALTLWEKIGGDRSVDWGAR
jgi:hypothetical protein